MTQVSIVYDLVRWEEKALMKAAQDRGLTVRMIDSSDIVMDLNGKVPEEFGDVTLQRSVSYYRGLHITAYLEYLGHPVVNDLNSTLISGNKMLSSLAFVKNRVPTPHTVVALSTEKAMEAFSGILGGRAVIKPVTGSWGRMVALLRDRDAAEAVLEDREHMYPLYSVSYLQEFVEKPGRDIRVFVAGDRALAAIYRYGGDQWRTNTARGGRAEKCPIDSELEDVAVRAARAVGPGVYGVDVMESKDGYLVHEINGTTEFKNTVAQTGVDIPGAIVDYALSVIK